ncbi:hypothetical protein CC79DRAFT_1326243 [Sarocladium strictum]
MPSFGRLSHLKHSNRSQHGLTVDPPQPPSSADPTAVAGAGAGAGTGTPSFGQQGHTTTGADAVTPHSASSTASSSIAASQQQHHFSDATSRPPQSVHPGNRNYDYQQSQPGQVAQPISHQQQQDAPHPAAHFYSTGSNPSDLQDSIGGGSPLYDTTRQHQHSRDRDQDQDQDFADAAAIGRSQSQRYSTILPAPQHHNHPLSTQNHHHLHHQFATASSSLDDLPSTAAYNHSLQSQPFAQQDSQQQQAPQPEKRSARKLIRGIFSGGSSRSAAAAAAAAAAQPDHASNQPPPPPPPHQQLPSQQQQAQQQQQQQQQQQNFQGHSQQNSYDNTAGLARRPSKRHQQPGQQQRSTDPDWQAQGSYSQLGSPLHDVGEADEYRRFAHPDSEQDYPNHDPGLGRNNTIRQVQQDNDSPGARGSRFLESQGEPQRRQDLSQPHVQVHTEDEPQHFESSSYESQQQPHPASFNQRAAQLSNPLQLGTPLQQQGDNAQFGRLSPQGNSETVSQFSHESPVTDNDQRTSSQLDRPSPALQYSNSSQEYLPNSSSVMAPPSGGPPPNRRVQETDKVLRGVEPPAGAPPGYRHPNTSANALSSLTPGAGGPGGPPNPAFRGDRPPQFDGQADHGRDSPQPSTQAPMALDAEGEKAFKDLLVKYKNVKRLYFDGKSQIEALSGQIETLQNAVANQRMSQSRTAWDDSEYSTRFNRLNGAINNLSFNIRKDWRSVPQWLNSYVSAEALKTGKQEMTAVGRAVISRWLMEEVFNKCFHPGLDPVLSAQLKEIELSIRGNSYTLHSQEEHDALTTKVVNWRMATLDGLQRKLNSNNTADNRTMFTTKATTNLTACLYQFLSSPPPAGVEGSTTMIVELAVAIAANIPLESRDVAITYPLPGDPITPHLMEVEKGGLPAADGQKGDGSEVDADEDGDKNSKNKAGVPKDNGRVRFAGFVALEVRGRQVLMKAPVWPL